MFRSLGTILAAFCSLLVITTGCGRSRSSITVAGSTAFQPFAEKLADEFMDKRADVSIVVQGGGSAVGIQATIAGAAQIGMADLVVLPPEASNLTSTVAARDGIAVIVNPENIITNLSMDQIRGIFNGSIRLWKEVGGADKPVTVVSREAGSGTRMSFEQIVKHIEMTKDALIQDSNGTIRETVANDANAIGYLSHGLVDQRITAVPVDGVICSTENIISGKYALVRPVYLLTQGLPVGAVKDFIEYVLSEEGQKTISQNGLIPAK